MLNFLGIGAQKSGSSWLHKVLLEHPKIAFPGGKEVHFWDQQSKHKHGISWYTQLFLNEELINGEITPAYAFLPIDVIQDIYNIEPNLRLIYLIRNPIDRAWSSARMALARAGMLHEEASDQWFIDHFKSSGSLARGDYESCIRNWRSVFPSNQLLIIRYDVMENRPVFIANTVLNHLGLNDFFEQSNQKNLSEKVFEGDGVSIRPTLLPVLQDIYIQRIESLEGYLKEDLSSWKRQADT